MNHLSEEQLVLHYYGDADSRASVKAHLTTCADCRGRFEQLSRELALMQSPAPERGEEYGTQVWNRIRAHLPEREPRQSGWVLRPRQWVVAGALAMLVIAAFLAGRFYPVSPAQPPTDAKNEKVRERILLVAVGDHLEQSQMLLLELTHASADGSVDISSERERAEQLVSANRLYRQTAGRQGAADVERVLDELERTLLEIAHQPAEVTPAQLQEIQQRIDSQGLLFKIRVVGSKVRRQGRTASPKSTTETRQTT